MSADPSSAVWPWLLAGDAAVRWRTLANLMDASGDDVTAERERVASTGWGARLLAEQAADGSWGGGMYSPKFVSTTYTLLHLMWLGLPAGHEAALRGLDRLWEWRRGWRVPEVCVESMLIRLTAAFEHPASGCDEVVADVLEQQQSDGGWNVRRARTAPSTAPSTRLSRRSRRSMPTAEVAGACPSRRSNVGGSSSCAITCTGPTGPGRW